VSTERVSHAYTSVGSALEIRLFRHRLPPANQSAAAAAVAYGAPTSAVVMPFLLQYTGTSDGFFVVVFNRFRHPTSISLYIGVAESMVTIRSPSCGYNLA